MTQRRATCSEFFRTQCSAIMLPFRSTFWSNLSIHALISFYYNIDSDVIGLTINLYQLDGTTNQLETVRLFQGQSKDSTNPAARKVDLKITCDAEMIMIVKGRYLLSFLLSQWLFTGFTIHPNSDSHTLNDPFFRVEIKNGWPIWNPLEATIIISRPSDVHNKPQKIAWEPPERLRPYIM